VTIGVDEDVLWLKVSMDDVVGVNMLDGKKLGGGVRTLEEKKWFN
jgi:hypothetical protein